MKNKLNTSEFYLKLYIAELEEQLQNIAMSKFCTKSSIHCYKMFMDYDKIFKKFKKTSYFEKYKNLIKKKNNESICDNCIYSCYNICLKKEN